jgi:hypothetical protein
MKKIYGDWGLGIGDWGLGLGGWGPNPNPTAPNPHPPLPNPQSPIPNPHSFYFFKKISLFLIKYIIIYFLFKKNEKLSNFIDNLHNF